MPYQLDTQLDQAQAERELGKAWEKLREERRTLTCGSLGCGTFLLIVTLAVFVIFHEEPIFGIVALIASVLFMALAVVGGKSHVDRAQRQVDLYQRRIERLRQAAAVPDRNTGPAQREASTAPPIQATWPAQRQDCSLVMVSCSLDRASAVASLQSEMEMGAEEANVLLDGMPCTLRERISCDAADLIAKRLRKKGFDIEVISTR